MGQLSNFCPHDLPVHEARWSDRIYLLLVVV